MEIETIKKVIPNEDILDDLANLFKILGDLTRVKILTVLEKSELCVNEICEAVDMTKSAVSHQLRLLRQAKLVKPRKDGKEVYYSLDDDHVTQIFNCGLSHVME